jgi:integrase
MAIRKLPSGKWQATVYVSASKRITATRLLKKEAEAWVREQQVALARGDWRDPRLAKVTFGEWFERWWSSRVVEPEGARNTRYMAEKHVLPYWSGWPLGAIGHLEVQSWVARMQKQGKGTPLIHKAYGLFRSAIRAAVREDIIGRDPCEDVDLPVMPKKIPKFYTVAEVQQIVVELDAGAERGSTKTRVHKPLHGTIATIMAWTGLRWEEAVALEVQHVNVLRRELEVAQVVTSARRLKGYSKDTPSHRVVPVPPHVLDRLAPFWQEANEAAPYVQAEPNRPKTEHRLLFRTIEGRPLSPTAWGNAWRGAHGRLQARLGRKAPPQFPPHTLRHTAASWLVQAGVDLYEVQRILGHGNADTTQAYAHLRPGVHRGVREAWAELLG